MLIAQLPLFPEAASTLAEDVDGLFFFILAVSVFFTLLVLSVGDESLLPWSRDTVQFFYQVGGMAVTAGAIAAGVRRQWGETVNLGALFFAAFLITRLTDWWWNWMPSYLFFLIIGLLALGLIVVFRQIRNRMEARL